MNRQALVVGMGIGQLYKEQLKKLGYDVVTVDTDTSRGADYTRLGDALKGHYDVAHVCTPNFTHEELAHAIAPYTNVLFVEKPGLKTAQHWRQLVDQCANTRIAMVKNNQWRPQMEQWCQDLTQSRLVRLNWINHDRVPNPGSWFTQRELAWGGVIRDLMPHMLSILAALLPSELNNLEPWSAHTMRNWQLADLQSTDYGAINAQGVYDVDDFAQICFCHNDINFVLRADWRSLDDNDISVNFYQPDRVHRYELGLCPDMVYGDMIADCVNNFNNDAFWNWQRSCDLWIHEIIDAVSN